MCHNGSIARHSYSESFFFQLGDPGLKKIEGFLTLHNAIFVSGTIGILQPFVGVHRVRDMCSQLQNIFMKSPTFCIENSLVKLNNRQS